METNPNNNSSHHPHSQTSSSTPYNRNSNTTTTNSQRKQNSSNLHSNVIAPHYNAIKERSLGERDQDPMIHLKNFNNWIKGVLIAETIKHLPLNFSVLDLAGGKAGDIKKIAFGHPGYVVLADIAEQSVIDARERYGSGHFKFPMTFLVGDCFSLKNGGILQFLPKELTFDLVSCQFSLHYAFETEERAQAAFSNATKKLKAGGYFIGTIPNSFRIVKKLQAQEGLSFGNSCYSIEFDQKEEFPPFGAKYIFSLKSAVNRLPEWLIHPEVLERLGNQYGLKLLELKDFHQYFHEHKDIPDYRRLLSVQKIFNKNGTISDDEWEVAGLYKVFVFRKEGHLTPSSSYPPPPNEIIKTSI